MKIRIGILNWLHLAKFTVILLILKIQQVFLNLKADAKYSAMLIEITVGTKNLAIFEVL